MFHVLKAMADLIYEEHKKWDSDKHRDQNTLPGLPEQQRVLPEFTSPFTLLQHLNRATGSYWVPEIRIRLKMFKTFKIILKGRNETAGQGQSPSWEIRR